MHDICILGSFVVDLMGRAGHLPLPGETVLGSAFRSGPGGKGSNQAVAAHRAGADTVFITKLGNDSFRNIALDFYSSERMITDYISTHQTEPTGAALILVDENSSQNSILVYPGACAKLDQNDLNASEPVICGSRVFLTQLETNLDIIEPAVKMFRKDNAPFRKTILNPAPARKIGREIVSLFDIIIPNEIEASIITGVEVTDSGSAEKAADVFIKMGVKTVIITMGEQGCFIKDSSVQPAAVTSVPPFRVKAVDTTGAGDAFNGGFAAAIARGLNLKEAAVFASATAALSVTKIGTAPSMPVYEDIMKLIGSSDV